MELLSSSLYEQETYPNQNNSSADRYLHLQDLAAGQMLEHSLPFQPYLIVTKIPGATKTSRSPSITNVFTFAGVFSVNDEVRYGWLTSRLWRDCHGMPPGPSRQSCSMAWSYKHSAWFGHIVISSRTVKKKHEADLIKFVNQISSAV